MKAALEAYRKAIEQRGGFYPEAHQDLGRVMYSMGDLEAANEEYSIAVRQRSPQAEAAAEREAHAAPGKSRKSRRTEVTAEELGTALRQTPAAADAGRSAQAPADHAPAREASSARKE